jgi:hypothetical protein
MVIESNRVCDVHKSPMRAYKCGKPRFKGYGPNGERIEEVQTSYQCPFCNSEKRIKAKQKEKVAANIKFVRMLELLKMLSKPISARQACKELQVCKRTVLRYIEVFRYVGMEIRCEHGRYHITKNIFTPSLASKVQASEI